MTKTYQNVKLGIEIDVPENWLIPGGEAIKTQFGDAIIFYCGFEENFNIEIGQSFSKSLEHIEEEFRRYTQGRKYTTIEFGRILVGNQEHVCARYRMGAEDWAKKYLLVFGEIEYDITANCFDQKSFVERERTWDSIVKSFRITTRLSHKKRQILEIESIKQRSCLTKDMAIFSRVIICKLFSSLKKVN